MDLQPVTLAARTVRLVPLSEQHAPGLAAVAEAEIFRYSFPPAELTPAGFAAQIADFNARADWLPFAIIDQASEQPLGVTCYLDIRAGNRGLEIGSTWLARPAQGSRVNPECKFLLLRHAFEVQQAIRVQLKTDGRNRQSQRAIEKLGATREGVLRQHVVMPDGYLRDTVMYSIIDRDWPNVKAGLIERMGYEP